MLEVDVDVGRLVALGRDETLKQKIEARGIDLGDAETKAYRRIGRRSAPLTENAARAREAHDVVHGEEIGRVVELANQGEFMRERRAHVVGNAVGIARARADLRERLKRGLRVRIALAQFLRIAVRKLVEAEGEPVEEARGLFNGCGRLGEEARHFARVLQMPLGVGLNQTPRRLQRHALADAGEHVGERAPLGNMHQHIVGGEQRRA